MTTDPSLAVATHRCHRPAVGLKPGDMWCCGNCDAVWLVVRHLDGVPTNNHPSNLVYGTFSENNDDSVRHRTHKEAKKDACQQGHPFTPDNTRIEARPNGRSARRCLTCQRAYDRQRRAAA